MSYELYLCHHGIKGQKWGIRRFQSTNGSLTRLGQKRYNKKVGNKMRKAAMDVAKQQSSMYVNAHNKAAKVYNADIDDFNKKYNQNYIKKYGKPQTDYESDEEYQKAHYDFYNKTYQKIFDKEYNKALGTAIESNKHYKEVRKLVNKYGNISLNAANRKDYEDAEALIREALKE